MVAGTTNTSRPRSAAVAAVSESADSGRLDDDHGGAERGDKVVAEQELVLARLRAAGEAAHERTGVGDP